MEPNSPKKIQFSVPLFQSQLDPQAAEHIRRRRPTPATLVFYTDPAASGAEDRKRISSQAENAELSPAQRKQGVFTPPTMKGREQADPHRACEDVREHHRLAQTHPDTPLEERPGAPPRRKDTPYQHLLPFATEGKLLKMPTDSSFPEEEEGLPELETLLQQLEPLPKQPKEAELLSKQLEPRPKELESLPKELESLPKVLESRPKELEPLPKELESLPKELEPVPKQPEGMIQQGDDGDP
ncbi:hypothetical protein COCON_G00197500 [Conger conger]|uniref:Protein phosphatase 1 regulatory subunit 1C n=1 Tax=Conger conger TaxID=82655 RepID=A0A9Q1HPD3_CONCO|nr:protein phosphatase 1 regulatory subunit 1A-like isoform X1 [Conger conger]KAJ8255886.1 hypothetical protein COCON_G00197500 [Conger conger]